MYVHASSDSPILLLLLYVFILFCYQTSFFFYCTILMNYTALSKPRIEIDYGDKVP